MGIKKGSGFTVIEVMLFLGVTGLLAIGILVGSGVAIGQQRYRDSVNSLKSLIQDQYSQTSNVINSRDRSWTCNGVATVTEETAGGGQPRGTSDCVLLGRFLTINESGTRITISNVTGNRITGNPSESSDIDELRTNYELGTSPIDQEIVDVSWGAQVVRQKTTTPLPLSILIIRSPLSGGVMTFSTEGVKTNLKEVIAAGNLNQTRDLCVNADAGTFMGGRMEVRISPFATSQGAIQIPPESGSVCD